MASREGYDDDPVAVIDLGTDRYDPAVDAVARPPLSAAHRLRIAVLALVGALVLATGGAAPPAPSPLRDGYALPLTSDGQFLLTSDRLYVANQPADGEAAVTAYDLTGRPVWSVPQPADGEHVGLSAAPGLLLFMSNNPGQGLVRTTALDAATGRPLWSFPDWLTPLSDTGAALVTEDVFPPDSRVEPGDQVPPGAMLQVGPDGSAYLATSREVTARVIDLATGTALWRTSQVTAAAALPAGGGRGPVVLVGLPDGGVELRDLRTGSVRWSLDRSGAPVRYAAQVGDVLLLVWDGPDAGAAGYSADLGRRLWEQTTPELDRRHFGVCAPMICLSDPGTGVEVRDPATGAVAWRAARVGHLQPSASGLVVYDERPRRVVDPATGRTVVELTGWREAEGFPPESAPLLLRRPTDTHQTWLGLLAREATAVRTLDVVPYVLSSCQLVPGVLACHADNRELRLWRYE
ncbi:PQQ-binding-like beta-propeller repeat protein [Plantactinospora sp. B24E8]|uniref:outer membrane protein assembly factor BamB family protein n=1 Tax=Plantactinospora sp. B24E8 TaxID=3153567 RepID=UPI00325DB8FC